MILHTIINILYWMYGGSCGIHVDTIYPKKKDLGTGACIIHLMIILYIII